MKLFIDDIRTVNMSHNSKKGLGEISDFVIVRDYLEFKKFVDENINQITLISFDHDLSCFKDGIEFTGKTACEYIIEKCLDNRIKFPDWYVHTDNTCGRENILGLILNYIDNIDGVDISKFRYFHRGYVNGKFI